MQLYKPWYYNTSHIKKYSISAWDEDLCARVSTIEPDDTVLLVDDGNKTFIKRFLLRNGMIAYVNINYLQEVL